MCSCAANRRNPHGKVGGWSLAVGGREERRWVEAGGRYRVLKMTSSQQGQLLMNCLV